ncbi:MAG: CAP domain-containing protein, partial [Saprospiraceae bacterium]|nr:CAP domain-containing protein [Saprospiraceae bacterium]
AHDAADLHSQRMAQYDFFAHCDLVNGSSPGSRMTDAGYFWNAVAENIAGNNANVQSAIAAWMDSPGHRAAMLSTTYREMGAGYDPDNDNDDTYADDGSCNPGLNYGDIDRYYTQTFGRRYNIYPLVIERELATTSNQMVDLYVYGPGSATSMRFSNDGVNWYNWMNYLPDYSWQLSAGDGMKTVYSEVSTGSNGSGTVYSSSDMIELINSCSPITFSNETLSGTQTYQSCEIVADPNVTISGDIIFQAPNVTLDNNVVVPAGATLEIQNQ